MNESPARNAKETIVEGAPLLLDIDEVCNRLRITRWTVYQLINKRRLKSVLIGRRRLVAAVDLAAFVDQLRAEEASDGR
jgi:excisionase family DNA binding protein